MTDKDDVIEVLARSKDPSTWSMLDQGRVYPQGELIQATLAQARKDIQALADAGLKITKEEGWQPIAQAAQVKKDGTEVLVYWLTQGVIVKAFYGDLEDGEGKNWYTDAADYLPSQELSHFMLLPDVPRNPVTGNPVGTDTEQAPPQSGQ